MNTPVLYSYRGCPYCLRARMALKYAGLKIILRSVELDDLPEEALAVSSHATVPSLVFSENEYLDESWDITKWAVQQNDPDNWAGENNEYLNEAEMLVETNDHSFRQDLEHYKDPDSHPEHPMAYYRKRGEEFLEELNEMLEENQFLLALHMTIADIAVFPFVRKFGLVDQGWFDKAPYPALQRWLNSMLESELFRAANKKHEIWQSGSTDIYL